MTETSETLLAALAFIFVVIVLGIVVGLVRVMFDKFSKKG